MTAFPRTPRFSEPAIDGCVPFRTNPKWVRAGKIRPAILLWALGVPIPLVLLFLLIRGCM